MDFLKNLGQLSFPKPNDIIINMMPFIMGDATSIPEEYVQYGSIIEACELPNEELGKVGYLTINESFVEKLNSQRRPGIHTEKHSEGAGEEVGVVLKEVYICPPTFLILVGRGTTMWIILDRMETANI